MTLRYLLLAAVFFLTPCEAAKKKGTDDGCGAALEDLTSRDHYEFAEGRFYASAEVMPNEDSYAGPVVPGQRSLDINMYLKDREGRTQTLRGKEEFHRIIRHFDGRFDQVLATWLPAQKDELSDVLEQFNRLTGEGMSPEEAAIKTWAGERAKEAGYDAVSFHTLEGTPGAYTKVKVRFRKP